MIDNRLISGENPFQPEKINIIIGESASGYTLQSSVDYNPKNPSLTATWADYSSAIPANKQHQVNNLPCGIWLRLKNNVGEVYFR